MSAGGKALTFICCVMAIPIGIIIGHEFTVNKKLTKLEQVLKDQETFMADAKTASDNESLQAHKSIYAAAHERYVSLINFI